MKADSIRALSGVCSADTAGNEVLMVRSTGDEF